MRLTSTARVEGDIIHKTIAIESGAHFEGSVQRAEDPLAGGEQGSSRATFSSGQVGRGGAAPGMGAPGIGGARCEAHRRLTPHLATGPDQLGPADITPIKKPGQASGFCLGRD